MARNLGASDRSRQDNVLNWRENVILRRVELLSRALEGKLAQLIVCRLNWAIMSGLNAAESDTPKV